MTVQNKRKFMLSLNREIFEFYKEKADARGITTQEYLRTVLAEHFLANGGGRRMMKLDV